MGGLDGTSSRFLLPLPPCGLCQQAPLASGGEEGGWDGRVTVLPRSQPYPSVGTDPIDPAAPRPADPVAPMAHPVNS